MSESDKVLRVALLAVPEVTASALYGMFDLFAGVGRDWEFLVDGKAGGSPFRPMIVTATGEPFHAANAVSVEPHCSLAGLPGPELVCIPEVLVAPDDDLSARYEAETAWLAACYAQGATLASACSGALLLAEAGLLNGQDATTHWGYCDALASRHPAVRVHPERALVVTGDGQRIVMAGGGTSWHDLALFLVARFVGVDAAMRVARVWLIDWHDIGQQPFAALARARQVDDAVIAGCQAWIAEHYDEDSPVSAMMRVSGLAERSFKRRFSRATGMSPLEYVHTLRLEEAKQVLETTDLPVEAVANEVGYEDASFFGRLFRRKIGLTPAQYRKRFGAMRKALETGMAVPTG